MVDALESTHPIISNALSQSRPFSLTGGNRLDIQVHSNGLVLKILEKHSSLIKQTITLQTNIKLNGEVSFFKASIIPQHHQQSLLPEYMDGLYKKELAKNKALRTRLNKQKEIAKLREKIVCGALLRLEKKYRITLKMYKKVRELTSQLLSGKPLLIEEIVEIVSDERDSETQDITVQSSHKRRIRL